MESVYNIGLTLSVSLLSIIIIYLMIRLIKTKVKPTKNETLLYRDWVIGVDLSKHEPIARTCFIKKVKDNGEVLVYVPALDELRTLIWIKSNNNFYFKDQMHLLKSITNDNSKDATE